MSEPTRLHAHSRRTFLKTAALGAAAAMSPRAQAKEEAPSGDIDAHVHVWTPDTAAYPLSARFDKSAMQPASFTPDELLAICRPHGVGRVVLVQMSFYEFDNRYMLDAIAARPGVFRGIGIVDLTKDDAAGTMRTLAKGGVTGLRLYADAKAVAGWLDDAAATKRAWDGAADAGLAMCLLANPDALPGIARLCERHPKTRVVIDHFARIGMDGTVREPDLDNLCRLADHKNVHVKVSAYYALGKKQAPYMDLGPMIRRLKGSFGAGRLMWGSDCPYQVQGGHTYAASIALIRNRLDFLTPEDKALILRGTAEKVFFS